MTERFRLFRAEEQERFSDERTVNLNLFDGEAFFGRLLCFQRGQSVPVPVHEHMDECFDVIEGEGTVIADGQEPAKPGTMLYIAAAETHGLRADGTAR